MKKLTIVILSALFFFSCSKENIDEVELIQKENEPTIVELDNNISFRMSSSNNSELKEGSAYRSTFANTQYIVASEGVIVECPGSSTSYDGEGIFFNISWLVLPESNLVFNASFTTVIDGKQRYVDNRSPTECGEVDLTVEFEEVDDRLIGTCTGSFYYLDYQGEPFIDCKNWVYAGILEASFDVPLIICN